MHHYIFSAWAIYIQLWTMLTDRNPGQQCAVVILQLEGAAMDLTRGFNAQIIAHGGTIDGTQLDPLSYLLVGLYSRCAPFDMETQLIAAAEFTGLRPLPPTPTEDRGPILQIEGSSC